MQDYTQSERPYIPTPVSKVKSKGIFLYQKEVFFRPNPFPSVIVYKKTTTYLLGIPVKTKTIKL